MGFENFPCKVDVTYVYKNTKRTIITQAGAEIVKTVKKGLHNPKVKKIVLHKLNNI